MSINFTRPRRPPRNEINDLITLIRPPPDNTRPQIQRSPFDMGNMSRPPLPNMGTFLNRGENPQNRRRTYVVSNRNGLPSMNRSPPIPGQPRREIGLIQNFERMQSRFEELANRRQMRREVLRRNLNEEMGPPPNILRIIDNFELRNSRVDEMMQNINDRLISRHMMLGIKRNKFKNKEESKLEIKKVLEKNKEFFEDNNIMKVTKMKEKKNKKNEEGRGVCAKRVSNEVMVLILLLFIYYFYSRIKLICLILIGSLVSLLLY